MMDSVDHVVPYGTKLHRGFDSNSWVGQADPRGVAVRPLHNPVLEAQHKQKQVTDGNTKQCKTYVNVV